MDRKSCKRERVWRHSNSNPVCAGVDASDSNDDCYPRCADTKVSTLNFRGPPDWRIERMKHTGFNDVERSPRASTDRGQEPRYGTSSESVAMRNPRSAWRYFIVGTLLLAPGCASRAPQMALNAPKLAAISSIRPDDIVVALALKKCTEKGCWWEVCVHEPRSESAWGVGWATASSQTRSRLARNAIGVFGTKFVDAEKCFPDDLRRALRQEGYQGPLLICGVFSQERLGLGFAQGYLEATLDLFDLSTDRLVFSRATHRQQTLPILWLQQYHDSNGNLNADGSAALQNAISELFDRIPAEEIQKLRHPASATAAIATADDRLK
jgi:hypothetical protein